MNIIDNSLGKDSYIKSIKPLESRGTSTVRVILSGQELIKNVFRRGE